MKPGPKPKNATLRLVKGGRSRDEPALSQAEKRWLMMNDIATGRPDLRDHKWLGKAARKIWTRILPLLPHLKTLDGFKLAAWCDGQADFEDALARSQWTTARRVEHRRAGDELGIEPDKNHLAVVDKPDPAEDFFGGQ